LRKCPDSEVIVIPIGSVVIALLIVLWIQVRRERAKARREGREYRPPFGERLIYFIGNILG
jgi:hypothetical protein